METKTKIQKNGIDMIFFHSKGDVSIDFIFNEMLIWDTYKLEELRFGKNDVVIDIGANIGTVSIYLAKKFPFLKIYAFEPSVKTYDFLCKNIKENKVKNVKSYNLAVWGESGKEMTLNYFPDAAGLSGFYVKNRMRQKVFTISFDDIIKKHLIEKIKFLKIDCEGSEYEIIYNAKKINKNVVDKVAVEIHQIRGQKDSRLAEYLLNEFGGERALIMFTKKKNVAARTWECIDRAIGKAGQFLGKYSPRLYKLLKNIKD